MTPIAQVFKWPLACNIIYLLKYTHEFSKLFWHHNLIFLKNISHDRGNTKQGNIGALAKVKAVFDLKPLIANFKHIDDIPKEAIDSSSMAMNIIQTFFANVKDKCNESELEM